MGVSFDTASSHDQILASDYFSARANDHVLCHICHRVRVTCFANSSNEAILDANVRFDDARVVDDQGIRHNCIEHIRGSTSWCLTHAVTQDFATTECRLVAV